MDARTLVFNCDGEEFSLQAFLPAGKPRGTVMVCHAWGGQSDFERGRAEQLAAQGYVGIAHDVYGTGVLAKNQEECSALMTPLLQDRDALGRRLLAGIIAAGQLPQVDASEMAAIGFCFGGQCVLDMARCGMPVKAVVSFHGVFAPLPEPSESINASVLVLHGYDDPLATPDDLLGLTRELTAANADWQVHAYGNTCHSFSASAIWLISAVKTPVESVTAVCVTVFIALRV